MLPWNPIAPISLTLPLIISKIISSVLSLFTISFNSFIVTFIAEVILVVTAGHKWFVKVHIHIHIL